MSRLEVKPAAGAAEKPCYWSGTPPQACHICAADLEPAYGGAAVFVDGATRDAGPWAVMCPSCHARVGYGLGAGRGQRYERQADGRYLKTGG